MKEKNILRLMYKPFPPPTPLAKTYIKEDMIGSYMYIANRKHTTSLKSFSLLEKYFDVVGVLGAGCYGKTYEVVDKLRYFKHFALKRTKTHLKQSLREANTLLELSNPCIISVFCCWKEYDSLFVETSLGALSLYEILDNYISVPDDMFWAVAYDLSFAIQECHDKGIVHLDIKPSNVLVTHKNYFSENDMSVSMLAPKFGNSPQQDNYTPNMVNYESMRISGINSCVSIDSYQNRVSPRIKKSVLALSDDNDNGDTFSLHDASYNPNVSNDHMVLSGSNSAMHRITTYRTVKYDPPLVKLGFRSLSDLQQNCIFYLIDFGQSYHAVDGQFSTDCTCGDSAYIDINFMRTGQPSFYSDMVSFALMLLEIVTGIKLPLSGPLFEKLRNNEWYDCFADNIFGENLREVVAYETDQLRNPRQLVSVEMWRAIGDILSGRTRTVREWRARYAGYLSQQKRSRLYRAVREFNDRLFQISDSQLVNRCVVISRYLYREVAARKRRQRSRRLGKTSGRGPAATKPGGTSPTKALSYDERRRLIKSYITDLNSFIAKGGSYLRSKNQPIIKQDMLDSVTVLYGSYCAKSAFRSISNMLQEEPDNFCRHSNHSPEFMNSQQQFSRSGQNEDPLLDQAFNFNTGENDEIFFQDEGKEGHKMNSFVHLSVVNEPTNELERTGDENSSSLDYNVLYDHDSNMLMPNIVPVHPEYDDSLHNIISQNTTEEGDTLLDTERVSVESAKHIVLGNDSKQSREGPTYYLGYMKGPSVEMSLPSPDISGNDQNIFSIKIKSKDHQYLQISRKSSSEISLESKYAQPYNKFDEISTENQITFDNVTTQASNFALSKARKEASTESDTHDYSSCCTSYAGRRNTQTFNNVYVKSTQIFSTLLSALETVTGIQSMVYYNPVTGDRMYQTPTEEPGYGGGAPNTRGRRRPGARAEQSEFSRLRVYGAFRPQSGTYNLLNLSELQYYGYRTPKVDKLLENFERREQNIVWCNKISLNRYLVYAGFCVIFLPLSYVLKLLKIMHLIRPYEVVINVCKAVMVVSITIMTFLLYQLNQYNIDFSQYTVYKKVFTMDIYIDTKKCKTSIFGYFLPIMLYFIHWSLFIASHGNVSVRFFTMMAIETVMLYFVGKQI